MGTFIHLCVGTPGGVYGLEEQMNSFCTMPIDSSKASQNPWLPQSYHCHSNIAPTNISASTRSFSVVPRSRTRGNGLKLENTRLPLNTRKPLLRWLSPSTGLSTEVAECPPLRIPKSHLDMDLSNWLQVSLLEHGGWTGSPEESPSNLSHSVTLWSDL